MQRAEKGIMAFTTYLKGRTKKFICVSDYFWKLLKVHLLFFYAVFK